MKVKQLWRQTPTELEGAINRFIKDKKVIDFKFVGVYPNLVAWVLYEDV